MAVDPEYIGKIKSVVARAIALTNIKSAPNELVKTLTSSVNWLFTVSAATLLWTLNNINNFTQVDIIPYKWLYLSVLIIFSVSTLIIGFFRLNLFAKNFMKNMAREKLIKLTDKIEYKIDTLSTDEASTTIEKGLDEFLSSYNQTIELFKTPIKILFIGVLLYLIGIILLTSYYITYIYQNL